MVVHLNRCVGIGSSLHLATPESKCSCSPLLVFPLQAQQAVHPPFFLTCIVILGCLEDGKLYRIT